MQHKTYIPIYSRRKSQICHFLIPCEIQSPVPIQQQSSCQRDDSPTTLGIGSASYKLVATNFGTVLVSLTWQLSARREMGCASSKQRRCPDCRTPYSTPMRRSSSMHAPDRRRRSGDGPSSNAYHVVALRSSTMGSHNFDLSDSDSTKTPLIVEGVSGGVEGRSESEGVGVGNINMIGKSSSKEEFSMGVMEAKTWSNMIEEKIPKVGPKTPTRTLPGEPETINAWELMDGLEDGVTPLRCRLNNHKRGFSFDVFLAQLPSKRPENDVASPKPFWHQLEIEDDAKWEQNSRSLVSFFDPDIISKFKKAMQELSPTHSYKESQGKAVQSHSAAAATAVAVRGDATPYKFSPPSPYRKDRAVLYFTSLRGVRKTYEDCCSVRTILKGVGVWIDERDVSMHSGFKEELKELLGEGCGDLPRVFIGGRLIGGVEEVRRMHVEGQLEKALERCEVAVGGPCGACGDVRFVPCHTCSGSCKVCYELEDEEGGDDEEFGFRRCPDCNENGIRHCPVCCD